MKQIKILSLVLGLSIPMISTSQVSVQNLEEIATQLVNAGRLNLQGHIYSHANNSGGVAAIGCQGNYCTIYAHPQAMAYKSVNTWAFIMGHEIGHFALGHNGCGKSGKQAEMDADVYGARLARTVGYDLSTYIAKLESQPNTCSESHGCWSERINNLRSSFGYGANTPHQCNNWTSWLAFPW